MNLLLAGLHGKVNRIVLNQKLNILRHCIRIRDFQFTVFHGLTENIHPGSHHDLSGRYVSCIQFTYHRRHGKHAVFHRLRQIPPDLKRNPRIQIPGLASILRGIRHPCHNTAISAHRSSAPLFPTQNDLTVTAQDTTDIRITVRQFDLLGLFLKLVLC